MAKQIEILTPEFVLAADKPGMYPDGLGLYLQVSKWNTKSWLFRYKRNYKLRSLGLGACHTITLMEARKRARKAREMLLDGIDPIDSKHEMRQTAMAEQARVMTFDQCATAYIDAKKPGWKNAKHAEQWTNTISTYASPTIGKLPVADVDTALVMRILQPIWATKTETATRLRSRIESILGWATVSGYRAGENPARWRDHLDNLLAKRSKVKKVEHHPALPYAEMGAFMDNLRKQGGMGAMALEFTIQTAARTGEVIGARWDEIDLPSKTWAVPAERMKAEKEHLVPLCERAIEILKELQPLGGEFVFPGLKPGKPLSNMAMLSLLKRMGRGDLTVHGFRSTFRDWAAEQTAYPHEMAEMALAHSVGNKTEAAYRRGNLFEKRIRMMQDWQRHCDTVQKPADNVLAMKAKTAT
ncbi:MAG: integrase arm-type DNA-binding domain-containing protein [Burkholderiales bacterium]|nr:integrase arm-type DNA-binding domain-containing protein [Burkholderiales bacterium]